MKREREKEKETWALVNQTIFSECSNSICAQGIFFPQTTQGSIFLIFKVLSQI